MIPFNNTANEIDIEFICPTCNETISVTIGNIPIPNYLSDNIGKSQNSEEQEIECPNCGAEYTAYIYVNIAEGNIDVCDNDNNPITGVTITSINVSEE